MVGSPCTVFAGGDLLPGDIRAAQKDYAGLQEVIVVAVIEVDQRPYCAACTGIQCLFNGARTAYFSSVVFFLPAFAETFPETLRIFKAPVNYHPR